MKSCLSVCIGALFAPLMFVSSVAARSEHRHETALIAGKGKAEPSIETH